jgi:ribosomal protein S18 acetylase RimI-like enzyme
MTIHQKDPLFSNALKTRRSKRKFMLDFGFKLAKQKRFVLYDNNQVAGALSLEIRRNSIFVYAVGLMEDFRRKGYGTYMMNFTEEFANKKNKKMVCFSVLLENTPAVSMYDKLGYSSMGVGFTLLRIFLWKLRPEIKNHQSDSVRISFRYLSNFQKTKAKSFYWWLEEIAAITNESIKLMADSDKLLEFDFKQEWSSYEIFTNDQPSGIFLVIPSNFFDTIILFSSPKLTWNKEWFYTFIQEIYDKKIIRSRLSPNVNKTSKQMELGKSSVLQIFLTHQHKDKIMTHLGEKFALHDETEDRQLLFKLLPEDRIS